MRKFIILIFILAITSVCVAQSIKGGLAVGLNISQVDGDEVFGYHKFGINAGPMAIVPVGKHFSASIETLYNQKGSLQRPRFSDSLNGAYKLILNYLEVPVLFCYSDKEIIKFGTGFSWGRLVQFKEWEHEKRVNWSDPYGPYKHSDVDVLLDLQLKIITGLSFNLRYAYSTGKIRTREYHNVVGDLWTRKQFNNLLSFRLVYIFKDKPSTKPKKDNNLE